ncbi:MAG: response regulator [Clostridiales bacterium]|nr:response regulator [Clostridiales bacterium]
MRILAIDDNTVNLATLEQELKDKYEVIPMISGRRAIKYLYCEKVDLILLDVQMPVMDGVETLREIRNMENGITVPVIFLTAMKDKDTVIEGSKLGIMDYITKPFDVEDLTSRIDRVFKRMGILPIEDMELLASVKAVLKDITLGRGKQALIKTDEVLKYQIDDEVTGRMRNARLKIERDELQAAGGVIIRVIKMLEKKMGIENQNSGLTINNRELNAKLLYILEDLENFSTKDALEKCKELKKYVLPENITFTLEKVIEDLISYDDDEAERLIKAMLDHVRVD